MQISKIARFSPQIREEVNRRLDRSEQHNRILEWLNSLPEVQALLKQEFDGEPVKRQNLQSWNKNGFRHWQLRQSALAFTEDSLPDDLDQATIEKMSAKLIRCLQIRYAAVAGSMPGPSGDPEVELRRLGDLCNNLTALRRGDLTAERLAIERQRLALEKSRSEVEMEKYCWEWTKRPDIQEKLFPHRDPEKIRREVERLVNRQLLGIDKPAPDLDENMDPAILI